MLYFWFLSFHLCVITVIYFTSVNLLSDSDGKETTYDAGDLGSIPGWEDALGEGMATHSSILALENPMDRGTWWATEGYSSQGQRDLDTADVTETTTIYYYYFCFKQLYFEST